MLSNAYFLAKFRFDTAENEPAKNLQNFRKCPENAHPTGPAQRPPSQDARRRGAANRGTLRVGRWSFLANRCSCHGIRQTLEGSFSAVSKPNFASKYAFESSRRDLHRVDRRQRQMCIRDRFSAVSKRNFARKYAFDSIFQALQDLHPFAPSKPCLLYTSPSPRDLSTSRMPSSA